MEKKERKAMKLRVLSAIFQMLLYICNLLIWRNKSSFTPLKYANTHMHVHTHTCTFTHTHTHVQTHTNTHTHMHVHTHTYTNTNTHISSQIILEIKIHTYYEIKLLSSNYSILPQMKYKPVMRPTDEYHFLVYNSLSFLDFLLVSQAFF